MQHVRYFARTFNAYTMSDYIEDADARATRLALRFAGNETYRDLVRDLAWFAKRTNNDVDHAWNKWRTHELELARDRLAAFIREHDV